MCAHDDVHGAFTDALDDLLLAVLRREPAKHFHRDRELAHALADVDPVLPRQHGGGHEDGDLLAAHHGFEGRANGDFGFTKTNIRAEQALHGFGSLHVALDLLHAAELVRRLAIQEGLLKLDLPFRVMRMGVTRHRAALGADAQHLRGKLFDALLRAPARLLPGGATELAQRGSLATDADVACDHVRLRHRHEELGLIGIMQHEHLFFFAAGGGAHLDAGIAGDAVIAVHHKIAVAQLAQDIARFSQRLGVIEFRAAHAACVLMPAKDFRAGEHRQSGCRDGEAAVEQTELGFRVLAGFR